MKNTTTKNINARYRDNGTWTIRDNGEVIAEGNNGIEGFWATVRDIRATTTKTVKVNMEPIV